MKIKVDKDNVTKTLKKNFKLLAFTTALSLMLSGCEEEIGTNIDSIEMIDFNSENDILSGVTKEIEVPGEDFKLQVKFNCMSLADNKWKITSDKKIMLTINTIGLDKDTKVWIDNIHMDTSIVSTKAAMDGIKQDSMDDRIHTSQLMGFPISDDKTFISLNAIEGQNESFIQGTVYGINGTTSGSVTEQRYTESDYLEKGVFANKISIVYGLLIQGPKDLEPRGVDAGINKEDDIYIRVCDTVETIENGESKYYKYNPDGTFEEIENSSAKEKVKK